MNYIPECMKIEEVVGLNLMESICDFKRIKFHSSSTLIKSLPYIPLC
jgi:hypothetical protein